MNDDFEKDFDKEEEENWVAALSPLFPSYPAYKDYFWRGCSKEEAAFLLDRILGDKDPPLPC